MKKMIFTILIFPAMAVTAQTRISFKKSPNTLKPVVEKVARDYYQNFNNIKGDTVNETESTIEFTSKVAPVDAISTSITKYIDPYSYTWQATMFQSEDYEAAVEKYKEYYKQLNNCTLTFYDKTSYKLVGGYDTPDESRAFASSILQLDAVNRDLELFKVEVALNYSLPDWTVKVMVYEKVADDKIRPTIEVPVN
ncbi:MAG: hypothetical protein KGM16_07630 [Bacteroidota bacterium]|nr:hypothetical protein [Bacteroidota bacterium]